MHSVEWGCFIGYEGASGIYIYWVRGASEGDATGTGGGNVEMEEAGDGRGTNRRQDGARQGKRNLFQLR